MSEVFKGYMTNTSLERGWASKDGMQSTIHRQPCGSATNAVIVQSVDDESLPHPKDGKEWKTRFGTSVKIESVPVWSDSFPSGKYVSLVREVDTGGVQVIPTSHLRERRPEDEHELWCPADKVLCCPDVNCVGPGKHPCICADGDRRSGQERRKGERRRNNFGLGARKNEPLRRTHSSTSGDRHCPDPRSGTDRRFS